MHFSKFLLLQLQAALASAETARTPCPTGIPIRVPALIDPALNTTNTSSPTHTTSTYIAPPLGFLTGIWYLTNSTLDSYKERGDLQWDCAPTFPNCLANNTADCFPGSLPGAWTDLNTWTLASPKDEPFRFDAIAPGNRSVASVLVYTVPRRVNFPDLGPDWDGVYDAVANPKGPLGSYQQSYTINSWGHDSKGVPFLTLFEQRGITHKNESRYPAALSVFSRVRTGVAAPTLSKVLRAMVDFGNPELTKMVNNMGPSKWNYNLPEGPVICGEKCMNNIK
ncbi:hypothetical protein NLG97_g4532 [Lecanicillium saksenae]|uniref:Uncharacterized protein n=1 Tax=Lecanicillium saksenae TaxID=468837 RepID=A0ACC1QW90_9HYPO|nr:hypothetical protein NLG97_g4532 [Lecanicillium saksenae]